MDHRDRPPLRLARRLATWIRWLVPAAALALYGWAAWHSPWLDGAERRRQAYLERIGREQPAPAEPAALAEAYWSRYPDVAVDAYFGRHGQLGPEGAHEHYQRHGRREGRVWGLP